MEKEREGNAVWSRRSGTRRLYEVKEGKAVWCRVKGSEGKKEEGES